MTRISVAKDPAARTLTLTAHFDAPVERVWQVWSDPRQLERWWGPPGYPATVTRHELVAGGIVTYFMEDAGGERHGGWWQVRAVDTPHTLEFDDGFADARGTPVPDGPLARVRVVLSDAAGGGGGTEMVVMVAWDSLEAMEQMLATGMDTGLATALEQIDALLAEP